METNIKNKVAAGLRRMKRKPEYLLFIDSVSLWTYDHNTISGIPILHTPHLIDMFEGSILFIPMWSNDHSGALADRKRFIDGYEDES